MTSHIVNYINDKIESNNISYDKIVLEKFNVYSAIVCKYNYIYKTEYEIKINKNTDTNNILSIIENYIIDNINIPELEIKPNETCTDIKTIKKVNAENVYIKPIYSLFDLHIKKEENNIYLYQLYKNPLQDNNEIVDHTVVKNGYMKFSAEIVDDYITIRIFIDITLNVPKMACKIIGTFLISTLIDDIETLFT